jgi:hypothetical protein
MKIADQDIIFISYDEPNAEINWADLSNKAPWAQRVHGVKGSDNAHKAAAALASTEWVITVDGDNQIDPEFLEIEITEMPGIEVYSWCGRNVINNLTYGNGGVKVWKKYFIENMKTHEAADSDSSQVDFCWESGYMNFPAVFSETIINATPFQAWRAGFREGVKMLTLKGIKVDKENLSSDIYWHNIHRLRIWSSVGSHVKNGIYAILGARQGSYMTYCTDWNYVDVRDFEKLKEIYNNTAIYFEDDEAACIEEIKKLGNIIKAELGFNWAYFDKDQSQYIIDLYAESIALGQTYYNKSPIWKSSF